MMNEVLHANVFFVIASIATVVFSIIVTLILFHVLKITKSIRSIVERIDEGSEMIAEDMANLREVVVEGGFFAKIIQFIMGLQGSDSKRTRKKK
jgi:uncharacterized protein (UPF0335 family)